MKAILIDDEPLALQYLERQLLKISGIEITGKFTDPVIGRNEILRGKVDVVFLDISLPEINGIQLAEQILEKKPGINIVFITAYHDYAVQAFELNALDYVLKPVRADRLLRTIERIQERIRTGSGQNKTSATDGWIYLSVFRQLSAGSPGGPLTAVHWRTAKAQELFLYLLQHRGQVVRKSILIELLWPEYEPDKVFPQLYTTVYHVRKTLSRFGEHFQITSAMEGYVLNIHRVLLDAEDWESRLASAGPLSSESVDDYLEIMKLYTGDYLQEYDYWWSESERHRLKRIWLSYSFQMADWLCSEGNAEKAAAVYIGICDRQPQAEEAHWALMKIYASMGKQPSVNRQYNALTSILMDELGVTPSVSITEWYRQWEQDAGFSQNDQDECSIP